MRIDANNANDPKWTAYALGEITNERERLEMEAILRQSPEVAAMVEEIREMAGWLKEELAAEPSEQLTPAQRELIEEKAAGTSFLGRLFGNRTAWVYATAVAAVVVIAFIAVRPFLQTNIPQASPILIAEVFEKTSAEQTTDLNNSDKPVPPSIPPVQPEIAAVEESVKEKNTVVEDYGFVAPKVIPDGLPPPTMSEPVLIPPNVQIDAGTMERISVMSGIVTEPSPPEAAIIAAPPPPPKPSPKPRSASMDIYATQSRGAGNTADARAAREVLKSIDADRASAAEVIRQRTESMDMEIVQPPAQRPGGNFNTETYDPISDNPFLDVIQNPLSTFSIDVDTASYSNLRRFLDNGRLPPKDSVRIEELVNYFDYDYEAPQDGKPFAVNVEMTEAPWNPQNRLLRIGLKGRELTKGKRPESNLVFLIDVSGSMSSSNRLPLVKESMKMLVDELTRSDRVAIVVYAGDTRLVLPSTSGNNKEKIRNAIDGLRAGGSTNGASGIQLAYQTAQENFIKGGVNRVILATDGDFNVGVTNRGDLTRLIEEKAKSGIYLSALGFGMDNYKDATLELLADKGRGNYAYIDTQNEARKVLVEQINSTLVAIAQDVKIQVEFNPTQVGAYRLLGYENRVMAKEDFNDDAKMAGVIGAGHMVTAFYELEPPGASNAKSGVDPLRYQEQPKVSASADSREFATVKIRSKEPEKETSVLTEYAVTEFHIRNFVNASGDFKFGAAVASFGMMLRDSPYKGSTDFESILGWAKAGKGNDLNGYREEFIRLVHRAASFPHR